MELHPVILALCAAGAIITFSMIVGAALVFSVNPVRVRK